MKYIALLLFLAPPVVFSQNVSNDYYLATIGDDFIGVYLPDVYIASLLETKNHSISMHLNDRNNYHDVLAVEKHIIYSNLKWHDQYAIRAIDGNSFRYIKNGIECKIIDNNGFSYTKIGNDPLRYTTAAIAFIANILFNSMLNQNIGVYIAERTIKIPFLYAFLGEDTFQIIIDDLFFEPDPSNEYMCCRFIFLFQTYFYQLLLHNYFQYYEYEK